MKLIKTITEEDFGRISTPEKWTTYPIRTGARAILVDGKSRIALMHVTKHNYYKLPGGGVEDGESTETGLKRELSEEVGANTIQIVSNIGQVDEYRDEWSMKTKHHCYIVRLIGPTINPERTEKEINYGYETVWANDIDIAIQLVESGKPAEYGQDFERLRELTFLQYAKDSNLVV